MRVDKEILRETMLGLEEAQLQASAETYEKYLERAHVDQERATDAQDASQAFQAGHYAEQFDAPLHAHASAIELIGGLDFAEAAEVRFGSVVKWGGQNFVISTLTDEFECQGETFMGISCDAPITAAMLGKSAGDSFEVNGMAHTIEDVY